MNFYPGGMIPDNMIIPPNVMPNENGINYFNNMFNKIGEFEGRIKKLEQRVSNLENNFSKKNSNYNEPDDSLYML